MNYKLTLLLLVLSLTKTGISQKTNFGVSGGITLASLHANSGDESENSASKIGFTGGIFLQTPISKNVAFNTGMNYVQKGWQAPDLDPDETDEMTLNYLEVPLNILYTNNGFFVGGGPVIGLGLSGKYKYSEFDGITTEDVTFGSDNDDVKQFEFSGNLLAGYQMKNGLMFSAGYNMGFTTLINPDMDGSIKNRFWSLKIGYLFSRK